MGKKEIGWGWGVEYFTKKGRTKPAPEAHFLSTTRTAGKTTSVGV